MEIIWNDETTSSYFVYVGGANGRAFTHVPNPVNNLLEAKHPAKVVVFKGSAKQIENAKNVFRDQNIKLRTYDVFYDDVFIMNETYFPLTKSSNIADFGHKY
jgi:hypothetical protein